MAGATRLKYSTNSRPTKKKYKKIKKYKKNIRRTNVKLTIPVPYAKSYVKLMKSLKSTHLIVRLNAVTEEKSTVLLGKQFQILTTRSVKKEDLAVQAHWRLNSLEGWPLVVVVDRSSKKIVRAHIHMTKDNLVCQN